MRVETMVLSGLFAACALFRASPAAAQQANGASTAAGQGAVAPTEAQAQPAPVLPPPPPPPPPYASPYPTPESSRNVSDEGYQERIRALKHWIEVAEHNGDEAEEERLKEELHRVKDSYSEYQKEYYTRYSGGMMGGGIALASVGGLGLFIGALLTLGKSDTEKAGYVTVGVSAACIGAGIPLAIVGGRRVPVETQDALVTNPILIVSPRGAALRVTF